MDNRAMLDMLSTCQCILGKLMDRATSTHDFLTRSDAYVVVELLKDICHTVEEKLNEEEDIHLQ